MLCTCLSLAVLSVAPTVCIVMQTVVHRACAEEKMANESFSFTSAVLIIRRNDLNYYHNGQSLIMQRNAAERQRTRSEARVDYTLSPIEAERQLYTHGICLFFSLPSPPLLRLPRLSYAGCARQEVGRFASFTLARNACTNFKQLHAFCFASFF